MPGVKPVAGGRSDDSNSAKSTSVLPGGDNIAATTIGIMHARVGKFNIGPWPRIANGCADLRCLRRVCFAFQPLPHFVEAKSSDPLVDVGQVE